MAGGSVTDRPQDRAAWVGMNAYGCFVAVLALLVAARYFVSHPHGSGHFLAAIGHGGYVLGALGLLHSYWRASVASEVVAGVILVASNITLLVGRVLGIGAAGPFTLWQAMLTVVLTLAVAARTAALLRGGTIYLPTWRR